MPSPFDETYPPGSDTGMDMLSHQGEEAGMLVEGRLELTVSGQVYVLESGDSYYFESSKPHRFRNPFDVPARLISATTPAIFNATSASRSKVRCDKASLRIAGPRIVSAGMACRYTDRRSRYRGRGRLATMRV